MKDINAFFADIHKASVDCDRISNDIHGRMAHLRTLVEQTRVVWKGAAAGQFNNLMNDFDIYARLLNDTLVDVSTGLRNNAVNYEDGEMTNLQSLQAVNGDIPGVRF